MLRTGLLTLLISIIIAGCGHRPGGELFNSIPSTQSGIGFINTIIPNDSFNILDYMYFYNGAGVCTGDIDQDGLEDIFFASNMGSCRLYRNLGNMQFEDITASAGVETSIWATGVVMVDINADQLLDIYVCAAGNPDPAMRENLLFVNNGDLTFREAAQEFGLADTSHTTHAAFFDYDRDGDLDVYLLNHQHQFYGPNDPLPRKLNGESPGTDKLFENTSEDPSKPSFRNVSAQAGITIEGFGLGVGISDIDNNGWPDIYVSNDFVSNDIMYLNQGDGTFRNEISTLLAHQSHNGMGNDLADLNNDGFCEIVVADMYPRRNKRRKLMMSNTSYDLFNIALDMGYEPQYPRNTLQWSNGLDSSTGDLLPFSEVGRFAGIHDTDWSWSTLFADFDNDGRKDLFISNGHLRDMTDLDFIVYRQQHSRFTTRAHRDSLYLALLYQMPEVRLPNHFFRNTGELRFEEKTSEWSDGTTGCSNGAAYADLDNDGDLDLVINNANEVASLLENTLVHSDETNYIVVELIGSTQNHYARGADIRCYSNGQVQYHEQFQERGYMSSTSSRVHIGLGVVESVDSIVVTWADRSTQTETAIELNSINRIQKNSQPATGDDQKQYRRSRVVSPGNRVFGD